MLLIVIFNIKTSFRFVLVTQLDKQSANKEMKMNTTTVLMGCGNTHNPVNNHCPL